MLPSLAAEGRAAKKFINLRNLRNLRINSYLRYAVDRGAEIRIYPQITKKFINLRNLRNLRINSYLRSAVHRVLCVKIFTRLGGKCRDPARRLYQDPGDRSGPGRPG